MHFFSGQGLFGKKKSSRELFKDVCILAANISMFITTVMNTKLIAGKAIHRRRHILKMKPSRSS